MLPQQKEETETCMLREISLGSRRLVWDLYSCVYAVKKKKKKKHREKIKNSSRV